MPAGFRGNFDPQSTSFLSSGSSLLNSSAFSSGDLSAPPLTTVTQPFHNTSLSPSALKKKGDVRYHERKHDDLSVSFDENSTKFHYSDGKGATGLSGASDPSSGSFLSMNSSGFSHMSQSAPLFEGGPSGALPSRLTSSVHSHARADGSSSTTFPHPRPAPRTGEFSTNRSNPAESTNSRPDSSHSSRSQPSRYSTLCDSRIQCHAGASIVFAFCVRLPKEDEVE